MKFTKDPVFALTRNWNGRTNVLTSDILVSQAFDPAKTPVPPPQSKYLAIWDTGATGSVVTQRVVQELNLVPTGRADVHTASGLANVNTYLVNIKLPENVGFVGIKVTEGVISGGVDVLVGMDIIGQGDLAVTNAEGRTCMSFRVPTNEHIDFVREINEFNSRYRNVFKSDDEKRRERNRAKSERRKNR